MPEYQYFYAERATTYSQFGSIDGIIGDTPVRRKELSPIFGMVS